MPAVVIHFEWCIVIKSTFLKHLLTLVLSLFSLQENVPIHSSLGCMRPPSWPLPDITFCTLPILPNYMVSSCNVEPVLNFMLVIFET